MYLHFPKHWNVFSHGQPGHRFQDRYRAHQRDLANRGMLRRLKRIFLAIAATVIGIVLVFTPGPAIVFFFLAGALLASDWLGMARTLDWLEIRLRRRWQRVDQTWRGLPAIGRVGLIAAVGGLSVATTYGAYRLTQ